MVRVEDLANLKGTLQKRLSNVVGNMGSIHEEVYSSYGTDQIVFLVEPTSHDILPVEQAIRRRLPGVSTECRSIQSFDDFDPLLEGRVCLIVKFDIEYALKAGNEYARLIIFTFLFLLCFVLLYRHLRDYDFDYLRYLTRPK